MLPIKKPLFDITQRDARDSFGKMHEYMERLLNDAFPGMNQRLDTDVLTPLTDVQETDTSVTVVTDMPGIDKGDIELEVKNNTLIISANKKQEEYKGYEGYVKRERSYIKIYREVPFTSEVTDEGATAQLIDGVLSVTIPKVPKAEKTKIKIE